MIEHLLIMLISHLVNKQRQSRQPVTIAFRESDELRADPVAALRHGPIRIGPCPSAIPPLVVAGCLALVAMGAVLLALMNSSTPLDQMPPAMRVLAGCGALLVIVAVPALGYWLVRRSVRGGEAELRADGVEFVDQSESVFCPWALFRAEGRPNRTGSRVTLPINPATLSAVEQRRDGSPTAIGADARTRSVQFLGDERVELRDRYHVRLDDVAALLQHIAWRMR